jgi:hypothetical protein
MPTFNRSLRGRFARSIVPSLAQTIALLPLLVACAGTPDAAAPRDYLYLWTGSADSTQQDFLAVVDVTEPAGDSTTYGRLVTTLPVPGTRNGPHHTEHELAADNQLFANGFASGKSWVFDLRVPDAPRIAAEFGDMDGFSHPHSFLRFPNGNVLGTFQMTHGDGGMRAGGLVEMTPRGELVSSVSADYVGADTGLRVYSGAVIPALDRIVTTSTDMVADFPEASRTLQVFRLSDRARLGNITLPGPRGPYSAEPRLMDDGRTLLVSTFSCGLFLVEGLEGDAPVATEVARFPERDGAYCAIPVIAGNYYVVTVPAWSAVVSLDISDPRAPREVSRVSFDSTDVPHWIAMSADRRRVVVTGYASMQHRVELLRFDATTGQLTRDERFREEGAAAPGFRMDNKTWPHGGAAKGVPHGAVFSRRQ